MPPMYRTAQFPCGGYQISLTTSTTGSISVAMNPPISSHAGSQSRCFRQLRTKRAATISRMPKFSAVKSNWLPGIVLCGGKCGVIVQSPSRHSGTAPDGASDTRHKRLSVFAFQHLALLPVKDRQTFWLAALVPNTVADAKGVQCECGSPFAVWRGRPERGRFDHVDMADVLHSMGGRGAAVRPPLGAEADRPSPLRPGFARWV